MVEGLSDAAKIIEDFARGRIGDATELMSRILDEAGKSINEALYVCQDLLTTGFSCLVDDWQDIGRFDRIHHWIIGVLIIIIGLAFLIFVAIKWLSGGL